MRAFEEFVLEQLDERDGLTCDGCGADGAIATDYAVTRAGVTAVGVLVSCEACGHCWP